MLAWAVGISIALVSASAGLPADVSPQVDVPQPRPVSDVSSGSSHSGASNRARARAPVALETQHGLTRYDNLAIRGLSWDANLEGGVRRSFNQDPNTSGWIRLRAGALLAGWPFFHALGPTVAVFGDRPLAIGLQYEFLNLELGSWGHGGFDVDLDGDPAVHLGFGYSLFGIQLQTVWQEGQSTPQVALLASVRIPIRILAMIPLMR